MLSLSNIERKICKTFMVVLSSHENKNNQHSQTENPSQSASGYF